MEEENTVSVEEIRKLKNGEFIHEYYTFIGRFRKKTLAAFK